MLELKFVRNRHCLTNKARIPFPCLCKDNLPVFDKRIECLRDKRVSKSVNCWIRMDSQKSFSSASTILLFLWADATDHNSQSSNHASVECDLSFEKAQRPTREVLVVRRAPPEVGGGLPESAIGRRYRIFKCWCQKHICIICMGRHLIAASSRNCNCIGSAEILIAFNPTTPFRVTELRQQQFGRTFDGIIRTQESGKSQSITVAARRTSTKRTVINLCPAGVSARIGDSVFNQQMV